MAIKYQFNKTSLNDLNKQLKVRKNALPTLKNKESALRLEVKRAKTKSEDLLTQLDASINLMNIWPLCGTNLNPVLSPYGMLCW